MWSAQSCVYARLNSMWWLCYYPNTPNYVKHGDKRVTQLCGHIQTCFFCLATRWGPGPGTLQAQKFFLQCEALCWKEYRFFPYKLQELGSTSQQFRLKYLYWAQFKSEKNNKVTPQDRIENISTRLQMWSLTHVEPKGGLKKGKWFWGGRRRAAVIESSSHRWGS